MPSNDSCSRMDCQDTPTMEFVIVALMANTGGASLCLQHAKELAEDFCKCNGYKTHSENLELAATEGRVFMHYNNEHELLVVVHDFDQRAFETIVDTVARKALEYEAKLELADLIFVKATGRTLEELSRQFYESMSKEEGGIFLSGQGFSNN